MSEFHGHLHLRAARREHGRTVLAAQAFRAPFHVSKPYWDADARVLHAQVVNPTAGILAGDRLESDVVVESGAALLMTTPSASRVFRMRDGEAECRQQFRVEADGWLDVMPEPLVPHRGSRYRQQTEIEVASGGAVFFVDQLMPGRIGHGEAWSWERLTLSLAARLDGELIVRERFEHSGAALGQLSLLAGTGETACFANALLIGESAAGDGEIWQRELAALHADGVWLGCSALRRGGWSLKLIARDPVRLRATLRGMRQILARYWPRLGCDPRKL